MVVLGFGFRIRVSTRTLARRQARLHEVLVSGSGFKIRVQGLGRFRIWEPGIRF